MQNLIQGNKIYSIYMIIQNVHINFPVASRIYFRLFMLRSMLFGEMKTEENEIS